MKTIPGNIKNLVDRDNPGNRQQKIKFFTSFEAMNEADAKEMAALSPSEHLQRAVWLTKKIFAEELKKPMDKKIKFK